MIRDPLPNAGERGWDKVFDIHPNSYLKHALMLKCGKYHLAQYIELFEWAGDPNQFNPTSPWLRFSDVSNTYVAFTVENIGSVVDHLRNVVFPKYPGTRFIQDPPMSFPLRGELCTSFFLVAPWGQWIEISEWSQSTPSHPHHSKRLQQQQHGEDENDIVVEVSERNSDLKPARVGTHVNSMDTPAVLIDLDAVDHNVQLLHSRLQGSVAWMPPVKAHRSPAFAEYLVRRGNASGIVVMKVAEAEIFARRMKRFPPRVIHIANEVVAPSKILRLCHLVKQYPAIEFRVNCDCDQNAADLSNAAKGANVTLNVFVEINIGHNRTGVDASEAAALAKTIVSKPNLVLGGIAGYEGHLPVLPPEEKTRQTKISHNKLHEARLNIEKALGIHVASVSAGGSSNYVDALNEKRISELQAGGGVTLADKLYLHLAHLASHGHISAVRVESTIVSVQRHPERATSDAGFKSVGWHPFAGLPIVLTEGTCLEASGLSAEHCRFKIATNCTSHNVRLGQRISLLPGYGDSFLGNQRFLYGIRKDTVEEIYQVEAFGASE